MKKLDQDEGKKLTDSKNEEKELTITAYRLKKGGVDPVYEIHLNMPIDSMSNYKLVREK